MFYLDNLMPFTRVSISDANIVNQKMVPALVDAIKAQGLALVVDKSSEAGPLFDPPPEKLATGVDGVFKYTGVLRFTDSIDM